MKTIFEPFRIKSIEPIKFTTLAERKEILKKAYYNPFLIQAENVMIDLLTDSGTNAMSAKQWGKIMEGDESYAGATSFYKFEKIIKEITGFNFVIPTHQGRAAEKILFSAIGGKGKYFPNNSNFDTTRANIESTGATAVDFVSEEGKNPESDFNFKGNMNIPELENFIIKVGSENIPFCMMTVTNNSIGAQPVSMQNIRDTKNLLKKYKIPFFMDACRFAENAYFIKIREAEFKNKTVIEIAKEMFSYFDGCTMSAKKDAIVNIGGFLALNDERIADMCKNNLIITEGYTTYGGLAGRDLEAIAQGLVEGLDEDYLFYRIKSTEYFGKKLLEAGIPIVNPPGGHAIYIDAKKMLPQISQSEFPGQSLVCEIFEIGGIRCCEVGSVMFGKKDETGNFVPSKLELVRLAIPRRVYTQSHIDYTIESIIEVNKNKNKLKGMKIIYEPEFLRHFTARFEKIN